MLPFEQGLDEFSWAHKLDNCSGIRVNPFAPIEILLGVFATIVALDNGLGDIYGGLVLLHDNVLSIVVRYLLDKSISKSFR